MGFQIKSTSNTGKWCMVLLVARYALAVIKKKIFKTWSRKILIPEVVPKTGYEKVVKKSPYL